MPYSTAPFVHHATSASSADILSNAREFIKDRLYFTWLSQAPPQFSDAHFFSIDHVLVYIAFFSDFGPNNISHVVRFCDLVEEKLSNPKTAQKKICLYSSHDPDKRANAAFLICAYMLIVHNQPPDIAFAPLAGAQPGFLPYRDAGYGAATYHITILDCLRGLYKGLTLGLLDLDGVDVDEYEFYEKVENGDFNWLTPKFLALANPKDDPPPSSLSASSSARTAPSSTGYQKSSASGAAYIAGPAAATASWAGGFVSLLSRTAAAVHAAPSSSSSSTSTPSSQASTTPRASATTSSSSAPPPSSSASATTTTTTTTPKKLRPAYRMADLIAYLRAHSLTTLVRLNNRTYDRTPLQEAGIEHVELYFPDGTTPPDGILMKFLELCETRANPIAVHCKAGLGRTGTLIAAYLMKHYKFSAAEIIAFLRILRPGCVVGPQQNYLQSMQIKLHRMHPTATLPTHISLLQPPTYPNQQRWKTRTPGSRSTPTPATSAAARTRHAPTVEEELAALERLSLVDDQQAGVNVHEVGGAGGGATKLDALPIPGQPRKNVAGATAAAAVSARDKEREMRAQISAAKELAKKAVPPAPYRAHQAHAVPTTAMTGFGNYTASTGSTRSSATSASLKPRTAKEDAGAQNGAASEAAATTGKNAKELLVVGKTAGEWKS
ncbi:Dual specificity protein phosphatase cdc14a [Geranomyces variabilis]|nr:Dual specificity protein phosphatase cdc14a [Geranomyces variabilis]